MVRYSTALSHLFLAGTGLYCLRLTTTSYELARLSYGIVALHSILGVWRWGNPTYGHKIHRIYHFTSILQDLMVLPGLVSTVWLNYSYLRELAFAHTLVSLLPLLAYFFQKENKDAIDGLAGANCLSLLLVSLYNQNYYGVTSTVSYILSYFCIKRDMVSYLPVETPTQDLYNYSMCFFNYFALKAINDCILV